jgi:hypothetical protein
LLKGNFIDRWFNPNLIMGVSCMVLLVLLLVLQLNTVHNQGLRLCLGAFRTSTIDSLYVAADEPSLDNRRIKLSLQYVVLSANPSNPAFNCVFHHCYPELYAAKPHTIKPLGLRILPHLDAAGLDLSIVTKTELFDYPPWDLNKPSILLDLTSSQKDSTSPLAYRQAFLALKARFLPWFLH